MNHIFSLSSWPILAFENIYILLSHDVVSFHEYMIYLFPNCLTTIDPKLFINVKILDLGNTIYQQMNISKY